MTQFLSLDFYTNRLQKQNNSVFSIGLENQYSNIADRFEDLDFEDFVRYYFIQKSVNVFISYPNFIRVPQESKSGNTSYTNIAIRFPQQSGNDIVLMGDIYEKMRDRHRTFTVKAILTMDPQTPHYGEISLEGCSTVIRLTEVLWESSETSTNWPTDEQKKNNVFTDNFMIDLNQKYVVSNPEKVLNTFEKWERYIESRNYLIDEESKKGLNLNECIPELIKAYAIIGKRDGYDYVPFTENNNAQAQNWILQNAEDSREGALLHVWFDRLQIELQNEAKGRKSFKGMIDGFTRAPNVLVNPKYLDKKNKPVSIVRIRDGRISPSKKETIHPEEELAELGKRCQQDIQKKKSDLAKNKAKELNSELQTYKIRELPPLVSKYRGEQTGPVTKRIEALHQTMVENERSQIKSEISNLSTEISKISEQRQSLEEKSEKCKAKINELSKKVEESGKKPNKIENQELKKLNDALKNTTEQIKKLDNSYDEIQKKTTTLNVKLKGVENKFNLQDMVNRELDTVCRGFENDSIASKRTNLEELLNKKYDRLESTEVKEIENDYEEQKKAADEQHTIERFHVFYELEVENESIDSLISRLRREMVPGLSIRKDFQGDLTVIDRQEKALHALKNGDVMNPFLSTALMDPSPKSGDMKVDIDSVEFLSDNLNDGQKQAVAKALSANGVFLIQGPPGTGKTQVIAELTAQLAIRGRNVLIASENNKAVDNAFSRLPKIPTIRPMRILSKDKEDNLYAMDRLMGNFYNNITGYMDKELHKYKDSKNYMDEFQSSIEELEAKSKLIKRYQKDAEDVQEKIQELREAIDQKYSEISKYQSSVDRARLSIEMLRDDLDAFRNLENEKTLATLIEELAKVGFDAKSFGMDPVSVIKTLSSTNTKDVDSEYDNVEFHQKLFELRAEKAKETSPKRITEINESIQRYLNINDVDEDELYPTLKKFSPLPEHDSMIAAINVVHENYTDALSTKERAISNKEKKIDESDIEDTKVNIKLLKEQIEALESDESYSLLYETNKDFNKKVQQILNRLNITISYNTPSQAVTELKRKKLEMERELSKDSESIEDRVKAYDRIVRYLRNENNIKDDSETYIQQLLKTVNVFGMTCTTKNNYEDATGGKVYLNNLNIDVVIVDEVSKIPFVELLQPVLYGKTVILVGDHRQLPPQFTERVDKEEIESGRYDPEIINEEKEQEYMNLYETSFFADLFTKTAKRNKITLTQQYRMHPDIMDIDNVFYDGQLTSGITGEMREHNIEIKGAFGKNIIKKKTHVLLVDCKGREIQESGSTSYYNEKEIDVVKKLLDGLNANCRYDRDGNPLTGTVNEFNDRRLSLGVICAYKDQANRIRGKKQKRYRSFVEKGDERFMVKTVDDFQGDERDIIILSMVRTNRTKFLQDYHRINVAISRARRLLIIVCNRKALEPMMVSIEDESGKGSKTKAIYREMFSKIEKNNGIITDEMVLGGE